MPRASGFNLSLTALFDSYGGALVREILPWVQGKAVSAGIFAPHLQRSPKVGQAPVRLCLFPV